MFNIDKNLVINHIKIIEKVLHAVCQTQHIENILYLQPFFKFPIGPHFSCNSPQ